MEIGSLRKVKFNIEFLQIFIYIISDYKYTLFAKIW